MDRLTERCSPERHQRALTVLMLRLEQTPDAATLAAEVRDARDRIKAARELAEDAIAHRIAATYTLYHADDVIDREVCTLSDAVLAALGGEHRAEHYQRLFHTPPERAMSERASVAQDRYVAHVLDTLEAHAADYGELVKRVATIREAQATIERARDALATSYQAEGDALSSLSLSVEEGRRLYHSVHARLQLLFPKQLDLVESFFCAI